MAESGVPNMILENRHGERLALRRMKRGDEVWLELKGSLPPRRGHARLPYRLTDARRAQYRSIQRGISADHRRAISADHRSKEPAGRPALPQGDPPCRKRPKAASQWSAPIRWAMSWPDSSSDNLVNALDVAVVRPALARSHQLVLKRAEAIHTRHVKDYI